MAPATILMAGRGKLALLLIVSGFGLGWTRTLCKRAIPGCTGPDCTEEIECFHGICDEEGNCECLPCYSGASCSTYDDKYGPRFAIREDIVIIMAHHSGVVYKAVAEDEDLGLTCPLGPGINTRCPCATIHYTIYDSNKEVHNLFTIHETSGLILLRPSAKLEPGRHYNVEIVASNTNDSKREPDHPMFDVQVLTVVVHKDDTLQDLLHQDVLPDNVPMVNNVVSDTVGIGYDGQEQDDNDPQHQSDDDTANTSNDNDQSREETQSGDESLQSSDPSSVQSNVESHAQSSLSKSRYEEHSYSMAGAPYHSSPLNDYTDIDDSSLMEPETLVRKKRYASGPTGSIGDANLTLTLTSPSISSLQPGNTLAYRLDIALPVLTTAIDLVAEIFVMDAVSGITPFALCDVTVTTIGSKITDATGAAITPSAIPVVNKLNANFGTFYDRAVIDFGQVKNGATYSAGQTDLSDSTISITFTATLITNTAYTNNTVVITAGAEYDNESMVWVSQETYSYSMATVTYPQAVTLTSPASVAQYSGGSFTITAFITDPFDQFLLEVYTVDQIYDRFTVSQVFLLSQGANFACMLPNNIVTTYYDSVSGKTVHRATFSTLLIAKFLDYSALTAAVTDTNYQLVFGFNIFVTDAQVGDVLNVGVGIVVGTSTVWSSTAQVSVTAGAAPVSSAATWGTVQPVTSTAVALQGTATWGFTVTIPSGQNSLVDCTATPGAGASVCGFNYGFVGANIAFIPKLYENVVNGSSGSLSFSLNFNSTGVFTTTGANDITFEVSVQYSTATPPTTSLSCVGGVSGTLTATSGTAGTGDMSGTVKSLVTDVTWYAGSQAGLLVTLNFTGGGVPYSSLVLEAAGDLSKTTWGARACNARVISAGKAVPCIAGSMGFTNDAVILQPAMSTSVFNDGIEMSLGPGCGTNRISPGSPSDYMVKIMLTYDLPPLQPAAVAGAFNLSVGISLASSLIWTGWESFTYTAAAPTGTPAVVFAISPVPTVTTLTPGVPTLVQVLLKIPPGSVGTYTIVFSVDNVLIISLCKIIIMNVGANFPCVDSNPYFKETIPYQPTTVVHSPTAWGLSATLNFGVLRNLGNGSLYPSNIGDDDSIVMGVLMKGVTAGTGTLTATLSNFGAVVTPSTTIFTVSSTPPNTGTVISVTVAGVDGTATAYEGVMKLVDFSLAVPVGYGKDVSATITNNDAATFSICFAAVYSAGVNLPCLIPSETTSNKTVSTPAQEVMDVQLKSVCYYPSTNNVSDSVAVLRVGAMFLPTLGTTATLSFVLTENGVAQAPVTFVITKTATAFNTTVNTTGMMIQPVNNGTQYVTPGMRTWIGIAFTIPRGVTTNVEVAVMTPTDSGRAYATVHGFRFDTSLAGKNLGCLLSNCMYYNPLIIQNSSTVIPMIHESQTDTLSTNLMYITNTELTYMYHTYQVQDDQMWFEADIWVADHPNATTGSIININFAVKAGNKIFVIVIPLTLDKTATQIFKIVTDIFLTDNTTTLFSQNNQVGLTLRAYHVINESTQEVNNAAVRLLKPVYLGMVPGVDDCVANITGNLTKLDYIDYDFDYLFFTDILEMNCTLTMDPNSTMPKGLGVVNATTLMRIVGCSNTNPTLMYCGNTSYVSYQLNGIDCTDPLGAPTFTACQVTASSAIDSTTGPLTAFTGPGWSPPVRAGAQWEEYITLDFLRVTRVTRITMQQVAGTLSVSTFKLQYSSSGQLFVDACDVVISVPTSGVVDLPSECRFESRFGRLIILSVSSSLGGAAVPTGTTPVAVRFSDWYGCYLSNTSSVCPGTLSTILSTDATRWRHAAYDAANAFLYFCDVDLIASNGLKCFCTADGATWNALPSYIGRLVGFDAATKMMYAVDKKGMSMVSSSDCVNWSIVATATAATVNTTVTPPTAVPGKAAASLGTVTVGGTWTADFTGLLLGGQYKAKWANCCS
nr:uncharacterized protein LOC123767314 [Procambarus clarkii]